MVLKGFDTEAQYREQLFKELIEIVGELGWQIAFTKQDDDEEVPGMIIGTEDFVEEVTEVLDGGSS